MKISGLQKVSLVDYDGQIATTIFTSGCNFACPFCHNAGLVKGIEPLIPIQEIFEHLTKRRNVISAVCISGGEPTLNPDLPEFISKIKEMGYLVKLDTNGSNLTMLKTLIENTLVDYIAMDIKNSIENYPQTINNQNTFPIQETINYIMSCGIPYEFRTTLVDGFHTESDILKIGKMINGAQKYYLQKFEDSGNCLKDNLKAIDIKEAEYFCKILKPYVTNTKLRGY